MSSVESVQGLEGQSDDNSRSTFGAVLKFYGSIMGLNNLTTDNKPETDTIVFGCEKVFKELPFDFF